MGEHIAWVQQPSVTQIIDQISWSSDAAYMYLEAVPQRFLDEAARQHGIQLRAYAADTPFDTWRRGRIFDAQQELKWEERQGAFHMVYCGCAAPDGLTIAHVFNSEPTPTSYFLWGQMVKAEDREDLGLGENDMAFVELQIPRILTYPVQPTQGGRLRVDVYEFYQPNGHLCYARWFGLR